MPTATANTDPVYLAAFEAERAAVLRRRIVWCMGILMVLLGISFVGSCFEYINYDEGITSLEVLALGVLQDVSILGMVLSTLFYVLGNRPDRRRLVRAISISTIATMFLASGFEIRGNLLVPTDFTSSPVLTPADAPLWATRWALATHAVLTALPLIVIPMRSAESIRIVIGCCAAFALLVGLLTGVDAATFARHAALAVVLPIPPMAWSHWRFLRFDAQFQHKDLQGRFSELSAELVQARRLHEALFPAPIDHGPVRITFTYEPMREIGGDFLFIHPASPPESSGTHPSSPPIWVVLIDVSGHGVPAALAVNRLHGELLRIFADAPPDAPADLITRLNRFVGLSLAPQAIFATAIVLRIGPSATSSGGLLQWCNAGHPPALLRSVAGKVHPLEPTATMLGVLDPDEFTADTRSLPIVPGDVAVAFTDGLPETRGPGGELLGFEAVQRTLADHASGPAQALTAAAAAYRVGRATDDILVVEIALAAQPAPTPHSGQADPAPIPRRS
ncbi:MAG: PP2C family protein-serine/threonine phosphatase [Phycisphaerales bacterium]